MPCCICEVRNAPAASPPRLSLVGAFQMPAVESESTRRRTRARTTHLASFCAREPIPQCAVATA